MNFFHTYKYIFSGISFFFAAIIAYSGWRKLNESDILETYVPADNIKSIPQDVPTTVQGVVNCSSPLTSPVSKKPCVYYSFAEERFEVTKDQNGKTTTGWHAVSSSQQRVPFTLQDQTGSIMIKPDGCEISGIQANITNGNPSLSSMGDANPLKDHKTITAIIDAEQMIGGPKVRYVESAIFVGDTINAYGITGMENDKIIIQKTKEYPVCF